MWSYALNLQITRTILGIAACPVRIKDEFEMKSNSSIITSLLALTMAIWMVPVAKAQPGEHGKSERSQRQIRQDQHQDERRDPRRYRQTMPTHETPRASNTPSYHGQVQIGGYFQERHREAAREYYGRPENQGFCPPGLAKKGNGCLPPGQAKKWRQGYALPAGLVYYDVPRSVVVTLGVPPSAYRYVRVASDILLIAVGTSIVVDAIENLVR
jgi:Ni/Co efflux regulator RcnB